MTTMEELCSRAKGAKIEVGLLDTTLKNQVLSDAADMLVSHSDHIIAANQKDVQHAREKMVSESMIDRLKLTESRILDMADGLRQIARLDDPIGEMISMKKRPNGLIIGNRRVPIGVVGIIYEARPNVTSDAFGLCFKAGNVCILKGGSDAIHSNQAVVSVIKEALLKNHVSEAAVNLIESTDRESTMEFMKMRDYVDVLIPRGGAGLIASVVKNATIPVIETGTGNCHIYVDQYANLDMALSIVENAKTSRVSVCNAAESLLVHKAVAKEFLPMLHKRFSTEKDVLLHGDGATAEILGNTTDHFVDATEEDWGKEYLDYQMSVKVVNSIDEAINHINRYNTGHSEAIVTKDYDEAQLFLNAVDAACVYVNASTRFTDGNEFGFGAEVGISTQKLHARGPMGLEALTSNKYIVYGSGRIR